jgi:SnoaL-like domain
MHRSIQIDLVPSRLPCRRTAVTARGNALCTHFFSKREVIMADDSRRVALEYIEACSRKDYNALTRLLAPTMTFVGPGNALTGAAPYLAVLRRLGPVWVRSDVKKMFVDGDEVCVIYDLVTDTSANAVPIVEWLRVENSQIASVTLFFDRVTFKPATEELARLAAR